MSAPPVDVALYLPLLAGGGAERCVLHLAGALHAADLTVELVLATGGGPLSTAIPDGVRTHDLGADSVLRSLLPLRDHLRATRPAVLLSSLSHANVVAVWARRLAGVPTSLVLWEHNMLSKVLADRGGPWPLVFPSAIRHSYRRADAIVAVTRRAADDLRTTTGLDEPVVMMPNPVITPELFRLAELPPAEPWLADRSVPTVVAVGRLVPQKDFRTLLHAFAIIRREREARLVVLGEGPEQQHLEALTHSLGIAEHVRFPGFVSNPYAAIARASVLACSSRFEGLPTVIIEALALGTPVVSTDCPSGPRELLQDGDHGRLVPVADPRSLADAVLATLDDDAEPPPDAAWRPYEAEAVAERFLDLFAALGTDLRRS